MRMRSNISGGGLLALFVVLVTTGQAWAEEVTLFSKLYHKDRGRPVTQVDQFTVPVGVTDVKLRVSNDAETAGEVKNLVISLNGVTVVGPKDFHPVPVAERPVLSSFTPNALEVTLRGTGGSSVEVSVVGTAVAPEPPSPPMPDSPIGLPPTQF